ncbi:histidine phosphatase family protein [Candidatus Kaiserbacteria bacterium]|nr:histidine phosphatase family protein [Candidatus Kaiserbacteria bacterium]
MEKHVYLIRHGESESNVDGVYRGRDAELTDTGREQAKAVAGRIKRIGVEALITSTFPRAHETAAIIGECIGLPVETEEQFGEWAEPTHIFGKHRDDPDRTAEREAVFAAHQDPHYRHTDEETFAELVARAEAVLRMLREHTKSRICVVTHGGFLRILVGVMVFGPDFTKKTFHHLLWHFPTTNTGVTYVKSGDEMRGWQVVTWNDQSHLG